MKRLLLGICLLFSTAQADNVEEFLSAARIEGEQYERLCGMMRVLEGFSLEDRTIMYLYLESLEDKELDKDEECCFECVALKDAQQ